jgi:hypothetical protein
LPIQNQHPDCNRPLADAALAQVSTDIVAAIRAEAVAKP